MTNIKALASAYIALHHAERQREEVEEVWSSPHYTALAAFADAVVEWRKYQVREIQGEV